MPHIDTSLAVTVVAFCPWATETADITTEEEIRKRSHDYIVICDDPMATSF
jgi:hypothetical protein